MAPASGFRQYLPVVCFLSLAIFAVMPFYFYFADKNDDLAAPTNQTTDDTNTNLLGANDGIDDGDEKTTPTTETTTAAPERRNGNSGLGIAIAVILAIALAIPMWMSFFRNKNKNKDGRFTGFGDIFKVTPTDDSDKKEVVAPTPTKAENMFRTAVDFLLPGMKYNGDKLSFVEPGSHIEEAGKTRMYEALHDNKLAADKIMVRIGDRLGDKAKNTIILQALKEAEKITNTTPLTEDQATGTGLLRQFETLLRDLNKTDFGLAEDTVEHNKKEAKEHK